MFTAVDLRIFGFTLTVCLSYLMKLADFFTSGIASPDTSTENASAEIVTLHTDHQTEIRKAKKATVPKSTSSATTAIASPPPPSSSMMTVNIRVEKPDIILVENMDDIDTNAIIFNVCTMKFKFNSCRFIPSCMTVVLPVCRT